MIPPIKALKGVDPEERRLRLKKVANKVKQHKLAADTAEEAADKVQSDIGLSPEKGIKGDMIMPVDYGNVFSPTTAKRLNLVGTPAWNKMRNILFKQKMHLNKFRKGKELLQKYTAKDPREREEGAEGTKFIRFSEKLPYSYSTISSLPQVQKWLNVRRTPKYYG